MRADSVRHALLAATLAALAVACMVIGFGGRLP